MFHYLSHDARKGMTNVRNECRVTAIASSAANDRNVVGSCRQVSVSDKSCIEPERHPRYASTDVEIVALLSFPYRLFDDARALSATDR